MESRRDLISVIVPVYNMAPYLSRCLKSICDQTYRWLEIILVDDGSTDDSFRLMKEFAACDNRIRVYHKENGGVSSARNLGLSVMSGEYCAFVDPDDCVAKEYIEWLYAAMEKTGSRLAICNGYSIKNSNRLDFPELPKHPTIESVRLTDHSLWDKASHAVCWGCLYNKDVIDGLRFDETLSVGEDTLFFFEALCRCDVFAFVNERPYYYLQYEASATKGSYTPKRWTEILAWQKVVQISGDVPSRFRESILAWYAMTCAKQYTILKYSEYSDGDKQRFLLGEMRKNYRAVLSIPRCKLAKKLRLLAFMVFPRMISPIQWWYYVKLGTVSDLI